MQFNILEQKSRLHILQEILNRIDCCELLKEIDTKYYAAKQQEYINEYCALLQAAADAVGEHNPDDLIGVI